MILLVFVNKYDKQSYLKGHDLPQYLRGDYVKLYTRYDDKQHEKCEIKDTLAKIKEYAQVFDKIVISFGLRLFPLSAYKDIVEKHKNTDTNLVFLKQLKGSKTWSINNNQLSFDNYRIADTGLFILQSKDIMKTKLNNFNHFLKELVSGKKMAYDYVPYWLFSNNFSTQRKKKKGKVKK